MNPLGVVIQSDLMEARYLWRSFSNPIPKQGRTSSSHVGYSVVERATELLYLTHIAIKTTEENIYQLTCRLIIRKFQTRIMLL